MEVTVRGSDVLVTTHKTYCESREAGNGIQAVTQYAPFQRFIAECEARGPAPRAITVRNIQRIAHRVVGVMADVEYVDAAGHITTQAIHFKEGNWAVLLPVAVADGKSYGILRAQRRAAASMNLTKEAFFGQLAEDGTFLCDDADMLTHLGFDLTALTPLGQGRTFTIGNEGEMPYSVLTARAPMSENQLQTLQDNRSQASASVPVAVPLEVVMSADDAKASLAASLLYLETA